MHGIAKTFLSARPFVCLSVCQTRGLWLKERHLCAVYIGTSQTFFSVKLIGGLFVSANFEYLIRATV